ncbi:DUF2459 domain-containing protein [Aquimarina sp. 2201CG5-10]|uniref:DUF2459 domain-containing protein n=1 Tax=Aquimarina callyspongiae TaxID=3098150 RepID=UPI002AB491ED|nr:DUF2459 domain-containing protein [Aquimarina sp. 2201CG5-10]MDY8134450.1 DUF2459 domain-containing protein [Aquimarina sp. 2201CG5-10]
MRIAKKALKVLGIILMFPILYLVVSLAFTYITVNNEKQDIEKEHTIYLSSNGMHLEIIIPKTILSPTLLDGLYHNNDVFFSFGWGDRNYYIKAATSLDFTTIDRYKAAFINTPALLHVSRYRTQRNDWLPIKMTSVQLIKINTYIQDTFKTHQGNNKIILPGISYGTYDNFYEANGNYNGFNTCNTWVNTGLKQSDTKACLWTPFDFGLLSIHKKQVN